MTEGFILEGIPPEVFWLTVVVAVAFIGIAKSGFGSGIGIIVFPLMVFVMDISKVAAVMLPLLILGDFNALYYHRKNKDWQMVLKIYLPSIAGVLVGSFIWYKTGQGNINQLQGYIKQFVGVIAVVFALYILFKENFYKALGNFKPNTVFIMLAGVLAGVFSTLAHAAGPIVSFILYASGMNKSLFVGVTVYTFTLLNLTKLPSYYLTGLIRTETIRFSLILIPFVIIGSFLGKQMHNRIPEKVFFHIVMFMVFFVGIQLIFKLNLILTIFGK